MVVSMNVAENLNRWFEVIFQQNWLCAKHLLNLSNQVQNLLLFYRKRFQKTLGRLTFFGLQ
jgi:hypothetical protein